MSSNSANPNPRVIVFIVYEGVTLLDVTGPAQVFSTANVENQSKAVLYQVHLASLHGGPVKTDTGIEINTISIDQLSNPIDTLAVAGGNGVFKATEEDRLVAWLKHQLPRARRSLSTCMGAFLVAKTGLLEHIEITTHWRWCEALQNQYPRLTVVAEPIYIKSKKFSSSAGVTSGIDLALALVEDDHGRDLSLAIAKSLVLYLKRTGGQSQFSALLVSQTLERSDQFGKLNTWMSANLDADLSVSALALKMGMSERSFSRRYADQVGQTPAKAVENLRLEGARRLLETTDRSIKAISLICGFKSYERMRRTFVRQIGIVPIEYRQKFGR